MLPILQESGLGIGPVVRYRYGAHIYARRRAIPASPPDSSGQSSSNPAAKIRPDQRKAITV